MSDFYLRDENDADCFMTSLHIDEDDVIMCETEIFTSIVVGNLVDVYDKEIRQLWAGVVAYAETLDVHIRRWIKSGDLEGIQDVYNHIYKCYEVIAKELGLEFCVD